MKAAHRIDNAKLGIFVLAGILFLILTLYMIGKNRNLLGATFTIKAMMNNVNGLVEGNNVRFKGIDVGTVKSIRIDSDTSIMVTLVIDKKVKPFIRRNAIASIGTDGLMGNKLVNINSRQGASDPVKEGDVIHSMKAIETDEMLRTLNTTNNNIERISSNLYDITEKLNSSNSLWTILSDTVIATDLKSAVSEFRAAGANTARLTRTANRVATRIEEGNGIALRLFSDTTMANDLTTAVKDLHTAAENTSTLMNDLRSTISLMKEGEGTAGLLLSDSVFRQKLDKSASNIESGTEKFSENMEALKSNFLFRRYFRKLERQKNKSSQARKD